MVNSARDSSESYSLDSPASRSFCRGGNTRSTGRKPKKKVILTDAVNVDLLIPMKGVEEDFDESNANLDRLLNDLESYRKSYQQKFKSSKILYKDLGKEIFQIECPVGIHVPSDWRLLSSTKALKRYWSPEVEKKVRELLECRETHKEVVKEMQGRLYGRFDADYEQWMRVVRSVANLDCLVSLAVFNEGGLGEPKCRPEFVEANGRRFVEFEELRHPCVVEGYVGL
jgi:DNA mismatch repair protein MSH6